LNEENKPYFGVFFLIFLASIVSRNSQAIASLLAWSNRVSILILIKNEAVLSIDLSLPLFLAFASIFELVSLPFPFDMTS
jgi:hypothetical protein